MLHTVCINLQKLIHNQLFWLVYMCMPFYRYAVTALTNDGHQQSQHAVCRCCFSMASHNLVIVY